MNEDEELEKLYQTSQLGWSQKLDIKKEFPTLDLDQSQNTPVSVAPMFKPVNKTVKVEKTKKKGQNKNQQDSNSKATQNVQTKSLASQQV